MIKVLEICWARKIGGSVNFWSFQVVKEGSNVQVSPARKLTITSPQIARVPRSPFLVPSPCSSSIKKSVWVSRSPRREEIEDGQERRARGELKVDGSVELGKDVHGVVDEVGDRLARDALRAEVGWIEWEVREKREGRGGGREDMR
jgi:hypothetical protein